jgi:hypothetical protein
MASGHEYRANRPNTWLLRLTPNVKILLANPEPSTHGSSRRFAAMQQYVGYQGHSGHRQAVRPPLYGFTA